MIIVGFIDLLCKSLSHQKGHIGSGLLKEIWNDFYDYEWPPYPVPALRTVLVPELERSLYHQPPEFQRGAWFLMRSPRWERLGKWLGKGWEKVEGCWCQPFLNFPTISQPFLVFFWGGELHRDPTSIDICELGFDLTPEWLKSGGVRVMKWMAFGNSNFYTIKRHLPGKP